MTAVTGETLPPLPEAARPHRRRRSRPALLLVAPYVLVWTLIMVPTIRTMARGWRPLSDDANIAIGAWRSLSLHPPLVGVLTDATGQVASYPGPLELWLLGPFVHLDPGQGVLLGSAVLCAAVLSVTLAVLVKSAGVWAGVVFSLCIADLALVTPTPFVDPAWNPDFGFFWFLAFLGVAFAIGMGNLRYLALLVFIGSVTIDSHLMYLPSIAVVAVLVAVSGFLLRRPSNYRWLIWTAGVTVVCWAPALIQQFTSSRPNLSLLLKGGITAPNQKTQGFVYGLRALSRAASPLPIWTSPRPNSAWAASGDFYRRNPLVALVAVLFVGIAIYAWRRRHRALFSLCLLSLGGAVGLVYLFAHIPDSYLFSFVWVNMPVWVVGVCLWLTIGLAAVTAWQDFRVAAPSRMAPGVVRVGALVLIGLATASATIVALFPYGGQFVLDWQGTARVNKMAAEIEQRVPRGPVGFGIRIKGTNYFEFDEDEHGLSYQLLTAGWVPGMEKTENQLLGLPIRPRSPFVVFNVNKGGVLESTDFYPHYVAEWSFLPPGSKG